MEIENTLPATPPPDAPPVVSTPEKSACILLVEDHDDTRRAMARLLTRWGYTVHCARSVAEALEIAPQHQPEILLSDLGLPDGSGIELLVKLRKGHSLRAVAMSGYGMEADLQQTREAGFDEHLVKPVAMDRLKQVLESMKAR